MSDLIGRFLSFEELMGRGLVKFAYYLGIFFLAVMLLFDMGNALIHGKFGALLIEPFKALLYLVLMRIAAELAMAVLEIDNRLVESMGPSYPNEAGQTPRPMSMGTETTIHDVQPDGDGASAVSPTPPVKKKAKKKSKKAASKMAPNNGEQGSSDDDPSTPT